MKRSRRTFLKKASLASLGIPLYKQQPNDSMQFAHHAMFWLKDGENNAERYKELVLALKSFKKIRQVKFLHVGAPSISEIDYEAAATDATYTISYLTLFESKAAKEQYLTDPMHGEFFKKFQPIIAKVVIYDSLHIA